MLFYFTLSIKLSAPMSIERNNNKNNNINNLVKFNEQKPTISAPSLACNYCCKNFSNYYLLASLLRSVDHSVQLLVLQVKGAFWV